MHKIYNLQYYQDQAAFILIKCGKPISFDFFARTYPAPTPDSH